MATEQSALDVLANAAKDNIVAGQDNFEWHGGVGAWGMDRDRHLVWGWGDCCWVLERMGPVLMKLGVRRRHRAMLVPWQVVERGNRRGRTGGGRPGGT